MGELFAILLAVGLPGFFLAVIYTLDLYASRTFRLVMVCFAWGAVGAFGIAYVVNSLLTPPLARLLSVDPRWLMVVLIAPVVEEIAKSGSLVYVSRRSAFTYFVDGAIYGFAAGIGFSIIENFLYLSRAPELGPALAATRAFSTCLMHGTAAGLVGVAVGRFRFQRRSGQSLALAGGWAVAILLHALFNSVVRGDLLASRLSVLVAVGIGIVGILSIAGFIVLGLREERAWLAETLDRQVGVSGAEMRAAQAYGNVEEVLKPIARQFPAQAAQVEALLLLQAQMGIKRQVHQRLEDPRLREQLGAEIAGMREEMERLRREIGSYVMMYVRAVFPEGALDVWGRLELLATQSGPQDLQRWANMLAGESEPTATRDIFGRMQELQ
jgi:RsiW-degrading membrane proteinase PrsW (M82 family)